MSILEVTELSAGYGARKVIENVSFSLEAGTTTGILGANGCGKTTLLKALCGILPSGGKISLLGSDPAALSPKKLARICRYIPQRSGISIDLPALDVVLMGFNPQLGLLEYPTAAMKAQAISALAQVGMAEKADTNYQTLSEGQKQLVILARTLLLNEGLLLLDEPESALDFGGRYRILELVRRWLGQPNRAAAVTLHDPQLALNTCDRLLVMKDGTILDTVHPSSDSPEKIEGVLQKIYGPLSVQVCYNREQKRQLVLLSE